MASKITATVEGKISYKQQDGKIIAASAPDWQYTIYVPAPWFVLPFTFNLYARNNGGQTEMLDSFTAEDRGVYLDQIALIEKCVNCGHESYLVCWDPETCIQNEIALCNNGAPFPNVTHYTSVKSYCGSQGKYGFSKIKDICESGDTFNCNGFYDCIPYALSQGSSFSNPQIAINEDGSFDLVAIAQIDPNNPHRCDDYRSYAPFSEPISINVTSADGQTGAGMFNDYDSLPPSSVIYYLISGLNSNNSPSSFAP